MRPVSSAFPINQPFGGMKTAGVVGDINKPDTVEYYVAKYGNYQPYGHAGCDIACPEGTPVVAMAAGTVLWADWGTNLPGDDSWSPSGYFQRWALYKGFPGIVTVIQHDGWIGVYAHLSQAFMNTGDRVKEGQRIALSGATGGVAPHLHVEALIDNNYTTGGGLIYGRTDPAPYFGSGGAAIGTQGTTITPIEEDTLSAAEVTQIIKAVQAEGQKTRDYVGQLLVSGYTVGGKQFPGDNMVNITTQNRVNATLNLVKAMAANPNLTPEQVTAAVQAGLAEGVVTVDVNVKGK